MSTANVTPTMMELTPCRVTFGSTPVDLGGTLNNVVVAIETELADIKADQLGSTRLDARVAGHTLKVTTTLSEIQNKDIWKVAFPFAVKHGATPNFNIELKNNVGFPYYSNAEPLVLHPLSKADLDISMDFNFGKAIATAVSEITFGPTEQQGLQVEWTIFPDADEDYRFLIVGDPAA
jgi:hypothetical protein